VGTLKKRMAGGLVFTLLIGCGQTVPTPSPDSDAVSSTQPTSEELAQEAAMETLESVRWPREIISKNILGQDMEFFLYHGNGWTLHVPVDWNEQLHGGWSSPSQKATFSVSKQFLSVENPKWYRAQLGAWQHETNYAPPFDYYYEDDGGYTPPEGSADYVYFFAPDGEDRSYEFTLYTVVGETSEEEKAIQEAMLLSFSLDDSSHVLNADVYTPGATEWNAAMAGLLVESEPLWLSRSYEQLLEANGKGTPEYLSFALALGDFVPGDFTQTYFGNKPEGAEGLGSDMITLCLPDLGIWLNFYNGSPWVHIHHAGEDYWAEVSCETAPEKSIFDTALTWLEAEVVWNTGHST